MTRDLRRTKAYFDERVGHDVQRISDVRAKRATPAADPSYEPQYVFELAKKHLHLLLRRYSRGDPIAALSQHFPPLLDAWEEAERLGRGVWTEQQQFTRHAWSVNLDHYIRSFWLVGLALALEVPDHQWQRLLALIGNEGEDALLDRVIASRQPARAIGAKLCHPKPYQRLLEATDAPPQRQGALLRGFVDHWYEGLDRPPKKKGLSPLTAMHERPYWHGNHESDDGYFGYWCIEAVAVVKAFGIDDTACLGAAHYPADLLRRDGPSAHTGGRADGGDAAATTHAPAASPGLRDKVRRLFAGR